MIHPARKRADTDFVDRYFADGNMDRRALPPFSYCRLHLRMTPCRSVPKISSGGCPFAVLTMQPSADEPCNGRPPLGDAWVMTVMQRNIGTTIEMQAQIRYARVDDCVDV